MESINELKIQSFRTDLEGTIQIRTDGNELFLVKSEKNPVWREYLLN